jgi:hypothetical protein
VTAVKMFWGPAAIGTFTASSTIGTTALNDADNAVGWVFNIPRAGSITEIGFLITATGGTPPAYNVGLVTLDSNGRPTTSAYGGSAVTGYTPTSTGWKWVTLSTPATANAGDFAAVHVYPTGTAPSGVNFITVARNGVADMGGATVQYTTSWTLSANPYTGPFAVKYSGGEIYGLALASNVIGVDVTSVSTPDEVGIKFTLPAAMTVYGARIGMGGWGVTATADVVLYDGSNSVLATTTISDKDFADANYANVFFSPVALSSATTYRLALKMTAASTTTVMKWTFESTAALAALPYGDACQYTSRTDAGAWTDDNVSVCPMALWVSDISGTIVGSATGGEYGYIG